MTDMEVKICVWSVITWSSICAFLCVKAVIDSRKYSKYASQPQTNSYKFTINIGTNSHVMDNKPINKADETKSSQIVVDKPQKTDEQPMLRFKHL